MSFEFDSIDRVFGFYLLWRNVPDMEARKSAAVSVESCQLLLILIGSNDVTGEEREGVSSEGGTRHCVYYRLKK